LKHIRGKALLANAFHAPELGHIEELQQALFLIGEDGEIRSVIRQEEENYSAEKQRVQASGELETLSEGSFLLPGFVDLHVHAPQCPQLGQALDVPLEVWLQKYTFPLEARYADIAFARRSYRLLVEDLLATGTTTALYFATIHQDATRLLADTCLELGQRALVGKVAMDNQDQCPDYYRDASPAAAVEGTQSLIDYVLDHPDNKAGRVKPVITPRFIPACSDAALSELGKLAHSCGCHVQTHCSESDWAHAYVLERHGMTDTDSLDRFGLLGRHTTLAHSNFLTAKNMETLAVRQSAVAHCPLSNAYFASSVFPLKTALAKGVNVGLGTDISGGPSGSMFDSMRGAILASRILESGVDPDLPFDARSKHLQSRIDFRDAFYLATTGGGVSLNLPIGKFEPGYQFDAMVIDTNAKAGTIRLWDDLDSGENILQKIIFTASKANIAKVFVSGDVVVG